MDHYWLDLPGPVWFSGANLYRRLVEGAEGPAVAVELGAWKGRSASFMGVEIASSGKPITFYSVDHWRGSAGEGGQQADPDVQAGQLFEAFQANIAPVADHVRPLRGETAQVARQFADRSVDFLYVDAGHNYESVMADLIAWYPKVRDGGLIAGDDWCFEQAGEASVRLAVLDFLGPAGADLRVERGSEPNCAWLQWWIVKTPGQRTASPLRRSAVRGWRSSARGLRRLKSALRF